MSISSVYNTKILEYARKINCSRKLEFPDGIGRAHSKLCGSTVSVQIKVDNGLVSDYAHDVKACALGKASASIFSFCVVDSSLDDLISLRKKMDSMLQKNGILPEGKFCDFKFLEPVRDYPVRHPSVLLVFDATIEALQQALSHKG
ncbi:iron-sulfur cluster assembly scaffold protein [Candidatus Endowatersipora endosymbiont of Watersipora subatra]|uniref:iron-sulfur cluster assembly scaffold protein n=1 Tax=Candidatus Endowatersipora endosymbiont of Watersipora subatra TaxID=3077946 RepID=UPI00312C741F